MVTNAELMKIYNNLSKLKGRRCLLYGTGEYTKKIISINKVLKLSIQGIVDFRLTENVIYNFKLLDIRKAVHLANNVIIVANLSVSPLIYQRIRPYLLPDTQVYYLNGKQPAVYDENITEFSYWANDWPQLEALAKNYAIISFDIFDTLCMRNCYRPDTIFSLLAEYAENHYDLHIDFAKERADAAQYCSRHQSKYFTLEMIYQRLQVVLGLSDTQCADLRRQEVSLERQLLFSRRKVIDFMRRMHDAGKKIILVSDMYLDESVIRGMLQNLGIGSFDQIYISSICKKNKYSGEMYSYLQKCYPGKHILHLGDNQAVDIKTAKAHGIDAFLIKSASSLLQDAGVQKKLPCMKQNLETDFLRGMFAAHYANNPFVLHKFRGKRLIDDMYEAGYCFWGPVVLYYMIWLCDMTKRLELNRLFFIARDAYILQQVFQDMRVCFPEGIKDTYFYTSRQSASVAAITKTEDIVFVVTHMLNVNSIMYEDILRKAFHIEPKADDGFQGEILREIGKETLLAHLLDGYKQDIFRQAEMERKNYLAYIKELQISTEERVGFLNFVGRGVSQRFVKKLLDATVKVDLYGLYFASEEAIRDIYPEQEKIYAAFETDTSLHTSRLNLVANCLAGEVIFTAPVGTVERFDVFGKPVFSKDANEKFSEIKKAHDGIRAYVKDFLRYRGMPKFEDLDKELIDEIYGLFFGPYVKLSDEVKSVFNFSDPYGGGNGKLLG